MEIKEIISSYMPSNSYCLVSDNEFLIVECSHSLDEIRDLVGEFDFIDKNNQNIENSSSLGNNYSQNEMHSTMHSTGKLKCKGVFLTHCHFDHIIYLDEYLKAGATFYLSRQCYDNLQDPRTNHSNYLAGKSIEFKIPDNQIVFLNENDLIKIGNESLRYKSLPGHTNCSGGLINKEIFVCGDLLFYGGGVGRFDLPTGSIADLRKSLDFCNDLDGEILVLSGHGQTFKIKDFKPFTI